MIQKLAFGMSTVFQLHSIEKACFGKDAWSINSIIGEFNNEYSHMFGEIVDGKVIGYVCVRIMYEEAQVCNIAVLPDYRRKGIATKLLETIAEFSHVQGCERCELEVNVGNTPAVELYTKCGYEIAGTRVNFYRRSRYATRDAYTMLRHL